MTLADFKSVIDKYISEDKMIYLIVGDKASQLDEMNKLGKGKVIELDIHANKIN